LTANDVVLEAFL